MVAVGRPARKGRGHGLNKERHGKVAKMEQWRMEARLLLQVLQNPLRGLFRKAALARASNDDGDDGHAFAPGGLPNERWEFDEGHRSRCVPTGSLRIQMFC